MNVWLTASYEKKGNKYFPERGKETDFVYLCLYWEAKCSRNRRCRDIKNRSTGDERLESLYNGGLC